MKVYDSSAVHVQDGSAAAMAPAVRQGHPDPQQTRLVLTGPELAASVPAADYEALQVSWPLGAWIHQ